MAEHSSLRDARARDWRMEPADLLRARFAGVIDSAETVDAQYVDSREEAVIGVAGMPFQAPVVAHLLADPSVFDFLSHHWSNRNSVLVRLEAQGPRVYRWDNGVSPMRDVPDPVLSRLHEILSEVDQWCGRLDERGQHVVDLRSPSPGPHFFVNLLLGDRLGKPRPLQTTPKSVVDYLGRGSFRSHAATQVLATRWDMRPEENGFPANRQFYLTEDGRQIFYSGDPHDENVVSASTVHGVNRTTITYTTRCGLEVTRIIFLLPYRDGEPLATEVQSITVRNLGHQPRQLRLVATGMFGAAAPGGLSEDVVYTTVSMEARVLKNPDGSIAAVSPYYQPAWAQGDVPFHAMLIHQGGRVSYPVEYGTSYNDFVGDGTLEHPAGLGLLSNRLSRKGPGFFALAAELSLSAGETSQIDNLTGLVSSKLDPGFDRTTLHRQVTKLLEHFQPADMVERELSCMEEFINRYRGHMQVESGDGRFDAYVNRNLPFQILYQTFVSRSFDQTQKGYREIGFREIQDLFASMPFFLAMGYRWLVKDLLHEWASKVFELGYAYHNFYWTGKEAGEWSDDALWLVQAVDRYVAQTGDLSILDEQCEVAGSDPPRKRSMYDVLKSILRYSGEISVGAHGLPLLDRADWNDTLRLDPDHLSGPQKEAAYARNLAAGNEGYPQFSTLSESVMNGFLLKVALDAVKGMARRKGDLTYAESLSAQSRQLRERMQQHAWKEDFFARVLINRFPDDRYTYLGAKGDGLSDDPQLDGTYFLNSFSWSVLSDVATEDQIRTMLGVMKRVLLTPHGLKLCSPVRFASLTGRGGSGEYFPGDRENGGVFKHADMMAAAALLKAAREVSDSALARELRDLAYSTIDVVLPFRTMSAPFELAGNPRFCTQYNNSETGENVGPILSGTSTWLWLALQSAFGITASPEGLLVDPILRDGQRSLRLSMDTGQARYLIEIEKPAGFARSRDRASVVAVDGWPTGPGPIPWFRDGEFHRVQIVYPE
ncbi:MAG: glycosyl transferase [Chloroflexota bacterium]|nr:MAG: glycosyl transferase [Chloroflexota bacterium]